MLRGLLHTLVLVGSLGGLAACGLDDTLTGSDNVHAMGGHEPDPIDPWAVLDRENREGPPRYTSRVHSCPKLRYATIGNVLASRGVDLAAVGPTTAGEIYRGSLASLGGPNYGARVRENIELGVAVTAKLFEIYIQAAPEIIATMSSTAACGGVGLFTNDGRCNAAGVTCLIGVPATQAHLDICDHTVSRGPDLETGQRLAIAVLASAAHTCE